jgi:hypothetical protein
MLTAINVESMPEESSPAIPLIDGLLVTGGTGLRTMSANWVLLVALDAPLSPPGFAEQIQQVRSALSDLCKKYGISPMFLDSWTDRLARIDPTIHHSPQRYRRGIFDIGGIILHGLFGVATNSDLEKYQKILSDLRVDTETIMHFLPELTSAINQTRVYVQQNRQRLTKMEEHQNVIAEYMKQLVFQQQGAAHRLGSLEILQQVDRILNALELVGELYHQERNLYHDQRAALEVGHLTEDLLPPKVLEDILQQAISQGYHVITQLEWYYQTLEVKPIWSDNDNLLYRVKIPLVDDELYLLYTILTFPIPYPTTSISAQLELHSTYGFNTQTGGLFIPHSCQGTNPAVCRPGPVYGPGTMLCPRGILTGSQKPQDSCTVTITKGTNDSLITEVDLNKFVITTWGEAILERCAGEAENKFRLQADTYIMTVRATCSISGENWTVHGISEQNIEKHLVHTQIVIPPRINVTVVLPEEKIPELFINSPNAERTAIPNIPLSLRFHKPQPDHVNKNSGHLLWATIALVLMIGACMIAMVYYVYTTKYRQLEDTILNPYVPVPTPLASITLRSDPEDISAPI